MVLLLMTNLEDWPNLPVRQAPPTKLPTQRLMRKGSNNKKTDKAGKVTLFKRHNKSCFEGVYIRVSKSCRCEKSVSCLSKFDSLPPCAGTVVVIDLKK